MISFKPRFFGNLKSIHIKHMSVVLLIAFLSGCQSSLNFAPVRYGKAEIQTLLADSSFEYLILQFTSANGESAKNPFKLLSYSYDTSGNPITTIPYSLLNDSISNPVNFKDSLIMGNQMASRSDLLEALVDPATSVIVNYDYLLFTPALDSTNHYVYYIIKPMRSIADSAVSAATSSQTQPCPPAICRAFGGQQ